MWGEFSKGSGGEIAFQAEGAKELRKQVSGENKHLRHMMQNGEGTEVPEGARDADGEQSKGAMSPEFYFQNTTLDFW